MLLIRCCFAIIVMGKRELVASLCLSSWCLVSVVSLFTGVIPISLFSLATGTVLRKAAIDRGVRLATGPYGCRQINKPSNSTVSVLIQCVILHFGV